MPSGGCLNQNAYPSYLGLPLLQVPDGPIVATQHLLPGLFESDQARPQRLVVAQSVPAQIAPVNQIEHALLLFVQAKATIRQSCLTDRLVGRPMCLKLLLAFDERLYLGLVALNLVLLI